MTAFERAVWKDPSTHIPVKLERGNFAFECDVFANDDIFTKKSNKPFQFPKRCDIARNIRVSGTEIEYVKLNDFQSGGTIYEWTNMQFFNKPDFHDIPFWIDNTTNDFESIELTILAKSEDIVIEYEGIYFRDRGELRKIPHSIRIENIEYGTKDGVAVITKHE